MKTSAFTLVAAMAAQLVAGQNRADYFPGCSLNCLDKGTKDATNCATDDAWCWCIQANYEAIYNAATLCVVNACGAGVAVNDVLPAAIPFCSAATSLHAAASTTAQQPPSSAPTQAATTSATVQPTTSAGAATTSASQTSAAGQSTKTAQTSAAVSSSSVVAATRSSNVTVARPSGTVVVVTGAAAQIGSIGAAAMLAVGALALF